MLKYTSIRMIDCHDWDELVQKTYGKPYHFQQQEGCQPRGTHRLTIPSEYADDDYMNESIPEKINGSKMGVKFATWLARDPLTPVNGRSDYHIGMFWERNFYPQLEVVANDLYAKGLIEAGDYTIKIDW